MYEFLCPPRASEAMHRLSCVSRAGSYADVRRGAMVAFDLLILRHSGDGEGCRIKAESVSTTVSSS